MKSRHRFQDLLRQFARASIAIVGRFTGKGGAMPDEISYNKSAGARAIFTLDMSPDGKDAQIVARVRGAFDGKIPPPAQLFAFLDREGLNVPNN